MESFGFVVVAIAILGFGLVSRRVQNSVLTPPMAFVAFGCLVSSHGLGLLDFHVDGKLIHTLAEITLVLVLFTDASRIDLRLLRREHDIPVRLLSFGLPLTILLGALLAKVIFPSLGIWEAALLAAILAPTDAALGQAVVSSPKVPVRIRQALNVESGLNDGIALPVVLLLFSVACALAQTESVTFWLIFAAKQVILGPVVGIVVGYGGGQLVDRASEKGWMSHTFVELAALALALLAFAGAELIGGNGFIAAFTAGMVLGNSSRSLKSMEEFAEAEGQLLTLLVFLVFGGAIVPETLAHLDLRIVIYGVLSLTVIRMLPVALSLIGKGLRRETFLFLGWFGPRGIASILFALLVVEREGGATHEHLLPIIMFTVLLSVVLHGISAAPGASWYARRTAAMSEHGDEELADVSEMPVRLPQRHLAQREIET